ncbi:hypothetical protein GF314_13425, partial [bacterium]|nr:hypothetical protein [bacterium]
MGERVEFGRGLVEVDDEGRIFVAVGYQVDGDPRVRVYRSTDHGTTFSLWGELDQDDGHQQLGDLDVAGGDVPRVFVTTISAQVGDVRISSADPAADSAVWSSQIVMSDPFIIFRNPQLDLDDRSFDGYYGYLVASGSDDDGRDIWFARSTDQGTSWAAPYRIASLSTNPDSAYLEPRISYGWGGVLHVAFTLRLTMQGGGEGGVLYLRAIDYANEPADWQASPTLIASVNDGVDDLALSLAASLDDATVVMAVASDPFSSDREVRLRASTDGGIQWPSGNEALLPWNGQASLAYRRAGAEFVGCGIVDVAPFDEAVVLSRASLGAPLTWSTPERYSDFDVLYSDPDLGLDPARNEQAALVFSLENALQDDIFHDAEWRDDPGFPNPEPFFPKPLDAAAVSPPALADVDGDGDLEIVFGDADDRVQVLHHDGEPLAGWPRTVPGLAPTPVAVGELRSGEVSVVVGTVDGAVHAFDAGGDLRDGWPATLATSAPTAVSIGHLGGPHLRVVAAAAGDRLEFFDDEGTAPEGAPGWTFDTGNMDTPPAIGDIDDDGVNEVVVGTGSWIVGVEMIGGVTDVVRGFPAAVSAAVSLADLDLDGRAEIIVPTEAGVLQVVDDDAADHPGFPFTSPTGSRLTAAAVANLLGNAEPEIAFSAREWTTHLLYQDGGEQSGYPVEPGTGWWAVAAPIIGLVDGASSDVVTVSRGGDVFAFDNFGGLVDGWPQPVTPQDQMELSPAMGDVDQDGRTEIVTVDQNLMVIDVGSEPNAAASTWAMFAHDARRSGCADCPEPVVTGVDPDQPTAVTQVRFAGAWPNPVAAASSEFRFAVPVRATAVLTVHDVRGRRVRSLLRGEIPAGSHTVRWNGRDQEGRRVASGQYLARLEVHG